MKMISNILAILLFAATSSSYAASWENLNAESAKALFSDVTIVHKNFKQYSASDGTQEGRWGGTTHTGKFFINDEGYYCSTWDEEGKREVGCWSLSKKKQKLKMSPESGRADKKYTVNVIQGKALDKITPLRTDEVVKLVSGMTVYGISSSGSKYRMYFAEDGSLTAGDKSTGTWEIKDGAVCNTWDHRGFAGCDKVYRKSNGDIFYEVPNGKKGKFRKFEDGNKL